MRSTKKTVSLFQSHVFKHEFFLFPVARSLFPLNRILCFPLPYLYPKFFRKLLQSLVTAKNNKI
jgi:hypothetical protein